MRIAFNRKPQSEIEKNTHSKISFLKFLFCCFSILSGLLCTVANGQVEQTKSAWDLNYELLRSQITVYQSYINISEYGKQLLAEADSLEASGEVELSKLYLEELLAEIRLTIDTNNSNLEVKTKSTNDSKILTNQFTLSVISGADYDRHEFEYSFLQNDSTILEEISKPYFGVNTKYVINNSVNSHFEIFNSARYDNANLRNDYSLSFKTNEIDASIGGYYNKSFDQLYSSYWENKITGSYTGFLSEHYKYHIFENYTYKQFYKSEYTSTDFYRNLFEIQGESFLNNVNFLGQYNLELNEYLGNNENDYLQHKLKFGYTNLNNLNFTHSVSAEGSSRHYEMIYGDSSFSNTYNQLLLEAEFDYKIFSYLDIRIEESFSRKLYQNQSTFEPDYYWNLTRPTLNVDIFSNLQTGIGYEYEIKNHDVFNDNSGSSKDLNYHSDGIFSSLNYFSANGSYINFSVSYQWRRYPDSPANDVINLYSSRNILSIVILGYIPLSNSLTLNILCLYDNDTDIDSDQGKTQSSIYNFELEYNF